jgi:hypothetical protein
MKQLSTPRNYLSWTQIDTWIRSPEKYKQKYFFGQEVDSGNAYMDYGKATADAIESGELTGDHLLDMAVALLTKYSEIEYEIRVPCKTPHGIVDLLGKIDTFDPETYKFREYKTGKTVWTQRRAQNHKQLYHYATMIYLKFGTLPPAIALDWLETEQTPTGMTFTGRRASYEVKIDLSDVIEYMTLVSRVAFEIDAAYKSEFNNLV